MDDMMLSMLQQLRKKISKKQGLPPAIIFQESSLVDMANNYPITVEEMSQIQGVGLGKAKKFAEPFNSTPLLYIISISDQELYAEITLTLFE